MELDQIEELVNIVSRTSVSEVTVRVGERRVTVRRRPQPPAPRRPERSSAGRPAPQTALTTTTIEHAPESEPMHWVTAPLVGIFYHAEPPMAVGISVEPGQVVGVIESMKLMNEVRADCGGLVVESAIEAGMAVEFGQPLFAVRDQHQEVEDESEG